MLETLRVGPTKIEKYPKRRQDGVHDKRRRPLHAVSTLPPGYPIGPSPESPRYPPAGYPAPGYGAGPGYAGPPPGYWSAPDYGPPSYGAPPGYGWGSQYGPPPVPGAAKPGIIPLRPLTLSEIFNGAVGYIRTNPKATLGLTAIVVVVMQIFTLIALFGPLAAHGKIHDRSGGRADLGGRRHVGSGHWLPACSSPGWAAYCSAECSPSSSGGRCSARRSLSAKRGPRSADGCRPCSAWRCSKPPSWRLFSGWWR